VIGASDIHSSKAAPPASLLSDQIQFAGRIGNRRLRFSLSSFQTIAGVQVLCSMQTEMFPDLPTVKLRARTKTKWEELNELCDLVDKHGPIIPCAMAAELLELSSQRVSQLVQAGTLPTVEFRGKKWVAERDIRAFIEVKRKPGRPWPQKQAA